MTTAPIMPEVGKEYYVATQGMYNWNGSNFSLQRAIVLALGTSAVRLEYQNDPVNGTLLHERVYKLSDIEFVEESSVLV